jgi:acetolactate synthase-1/2/3 large subunit
VVETINEISKGEAVVCTGVGQHQMWAAQYGRYAHPRSFITSGSMGTMGFGLPASIGAQVAMKDRTVIDVDGDGSLRMNLGELETATTYGIPVKVLLLNNLGDGMVRQWQTLYFGERLSGSDKALHRKDFIKAAEADGYAFAKRVSDVAELEDVIRAWYEYDGPAFLEVMIDPNAHVYPMVGPGQSYRQMITGEHISGRSESEFSRDDKDMTKIPDLF